MDAQLREMITFLVKQQFVRKGDIITDRMKIQDVKIVGSGRIINKFLDLLFKNIPDLTEGNYEDYLTKICSACNIEVGGMFQAFSRRVSILNPEDQIPPLMLSTLMGEFLGTIREVAFSGTLMEIKNRVLRKLKLADNAKLEFEKEFAENVGNLHERNEVNLSLLYNLCFLEFLADLMHSPKVKKTSRIQLGKYMNRVVELLSKN
jgi:hypothetical protein